MSDMRLIVAGAGGLMGRTLIHAIAATDGVALAGVVENDTETVVALFDGSHAAPESTEEGSPRSSDANPTQTQ